jgi:hypothetical protein
MGRNKENEMKKNEVTVKEASLPASVEATTSWGLDETISGADVRIPRILLTQAISERVVQDKCQAGDMVNSITGEVLAEKKGTVNIVPIYIYKDWSISEEIGGKFEFKMLEAYTAQNANRPWEEVVAGVKVQNNLGINVLCMLEKDLSDPTAFPFLMTFRRTNSACGKDIAGYGVKASQAQAPACMFTITIGTESKKNSKGSFYINKIVGAKKTEKLNEVAMDLKKWYDLFKQGKAVVVDSEVEATDAIIDGKEFDGQF